MICSFNRTAARHVRRGLAALGVVVAATAFADPSFYTARVGPIFDKHCVVCHGPEKQKAGLRLDSFEHAIRGAKSGEVIAAGNVKESELFRRITLPKDDEEVMPNDGKPLLAADEIKVIVPAGHALAGRSTVKAQELAGYPLLLPKSGTTRTRINAWLEPVEEELQTSMELDSTEMIKQFVLAGLGISFMAAAHCSAEVESGRMSMASLAPEPMVRRLGLIYRKDKGLSKAALGFIQAMLDHAAPGTQRSRDIQSNAAAARE